MTRRSARSRACTTCGISERPGGERLEPSPVALRCSVCRAQRADQRRTAALAGGLVVVMAGAYVSIGTSTLRIAALVALGILAAGWWAVARRERKAEEDVPGRYPLAELLALAHTDPSGRIAVAAARALHGENRDDEAVALARESLAAARRADAPAMICAELAHELARSLVHQALELGTLDDLDPEVRVEVDQVSGEAARVLGTDPMVLDTRALVLVALGHRGQAMALLERALDAAKRPVDQASLTAHLALAQARSGNLTLARSLVLEARRIDPGCSAVTLVTRLIAEDEVRYLLGHLWLPAAANDEARTATVLERQPPNLAQLLVAVGTFLRAEWPMTEKARVIREELPDRIFGSDHEAVCFLDDLGAGLATLAPRREVETPRPAVIRAGGFMPHTTAAD